MREEVQEDMTNAEARLNAHLSSSGPGFDI